MVPVELVPLPMLPVEPVLGVVGLALGLVVVEPLVAPEPLV
jgi:hypothetical protein